MANNTQKQREDYTVGVVCPIDIELAAVKRMLDDEHTGLPNSTNDSNIYTLGSISGHNVVIACLPSQAGTDSAAEVVVQMQAAFPFIRFGLLIGVGGGAPSEEKDIRLGDVVVSRPGNGHGGVVQYDCGKATPSGITRTGSLNRPPSILLAAMQTLKADYLSGNKRPLVYPPKLDALATFTREKTGPDRLFNAAYLHVGGDAGDPCKQCSEAELVNRLPRNNEEIVIHYGTIASGNLVIRDAVARDNLCSELGGVLCFEMEAAGLMNRFPCLVIRGICDYADSHKNKKWQPYAAGAAVAYAKELLSVIPPIDLARSRTMDEIGEKNRDLIRQETRYLIQRGEAQVTIGRTRSQQCSDKSRESDQMVSDLLSTFLAFLYRLLWQFWAASALFSLLNQTVDQNTSTIDSVIKSSKNLVAESKRDLYDSNDTIDQLDEAEEQIKNWIQPSQQNDVCNSGKTVNDDAELQIPDQNNQPGQSSNEIPEPPVDPEELTELCQECSKIKRQLQHTAIDIYQKTAILDAQVSRLEKLQETTKSMRETSVGMGFWKTVRMWIGWLLNYGSDNSESQMTLTVKKDFQRRLIEDKDEGDS